MYFMLISSLEQMDPHSCEYESESEFIFLSFVALVVVLLLTVNQSLVPLNWQPGVQWLTEC